MPKPIKSIHQLARIISSYLLKIGSILIKLLIAIGDISIYLLLYIIRLFFSVGLALWLILKSLWRVFKKFTQKSFRATTHFTIPHFSFKMVYFFWGFIVAAIFFMISQGISFINALPDPSLIGRVNYAVSTQILDRKGRLLYELYKNENRNPIKIDDLPSYIIQATIAIEDKEFYSHNGISIYGGIIRALKEMILKRSLQGGSTITQQLVKTALLTPERTIERKIREMILAIWAERKYSKKQILEMYLNQVPYGGTAYGIEQAAETYFGKPAKDLTLSEAAYLAGLPQAPSLYSPFTNPIWALKRRNQVLKEMFELKNINQEEYDQAVQEVLTIMPVKRTIKAPHFVFYVKTLLDELYGNQKIDTAGFRVRTSLDLDIQEKVESILNEELDKVKNLNISNGAILVTYPQTGEILAMVGSRDYFEEPYGAFNATLAERQPGSAIKPLMYSLALENGYTAASIIDDVPVVFVQKGAKPYRPVNYDGKFHGKVSLRLALANSYNVPAVRTLNTLGINKFINHARRLGITTWNQPERYGLALTLGGGEVSMVDMGVAYGVFANGGKRVDLSPILDIHDYRGVTIYEPKQVISKPVLSSGVSFIISDILADSEARRMAFGTSPYLSIPNYKVAVKTGTTNEMRDNWTIGFTPKILVASWVGNNDNSPMNRQLTSGITGAAPIWHSVMSYLLPLDIRSGFEFAENVSNEFKKPEEVMTKKCYFNRDEYFIKGSEEMVNCNVSPYSGITPTP